MTIVSCENLSNNGSCTQTMVTDLARLQSGREPNWIRDNVSFPDSMVDRIVPATNNADIKYLLAETGIEDSGLVLCEPFSQWVIENNFATTRPAWEIGGAQIVHDVAPFEQTKLRLLNAAHSALAYLGMRSGYEFIHEAMADPLLARFVSYLPDKEIRLVTTGPDDFDLSAYQAKILERFANPAIAYRTAQVANDGSVKLQQRIYPSIDTHLVRGTFPAGLVLVVAAWLQCLARPTLASQFVDPISERVRPEDKWLEKLSAESKSAGLIWEDARFRNWVSQASSNIDAEGIGTTLRRIMA